MVANRARNLVNKPLTPKFMRTLRKKRRQWISFNALRKPNLSYLICVKTVYLHLSIRRRLMKKLFLQPAAFTIYWHCQIFLCSHSYYKRYRKTNRKFIRSFYSSLQFNILSLRNPKICDMSRQGQSAPSGRSFEELFTEPSGAPTDRPCTDSRSYWKKW